jgi:hypothetical protein
MLSSSSTRERPGIKSQAHVSKSGALSAAGSLRLHWPEYLMEAGESGVYLFSACGRAARTSIRKCCAHRRTGSGLAGDDRGKQPMKKPIEAAQEEEKLHTRNTSASLAERASG